MTEVHSVLVTGASRGLGLEFVRQLLASSLLKSNAVIAACRSPEQASALQELQKSHTNLHILKLDVTEPDTFEYVATEVRSIVGGKGLTLLINNAGIGSAEHTMDEVTAKGLSSILSTNVVGPIVLTKALLPLLKLSAKKNALNDNNGLSITRAAVINISSMGGSILVSGTDKWRGAFGYRESKAALNMNTQVMAKLLREDGILVESLHPGHVRTDLGGPNAPVDICNSVTGMLQVMLKLTEKNKNGFWSWEGDVIPF